MPSVQVTPAPAGAVERGPKARRNNWQSLKCWAEPFGRIIRREKRGEFRSIADRVFVVGEFLNLYEWDDQAQKYTGDHCTVRVTSIDVGPEFDIPAGYALLSISLHSLLSEPPKGTRDVMDDDPTCPVCLRYYDDPVTN